MDEANEPPEAPAAGPLPADVSAWLAEADRQRDELRVMLDEHSTAALVWRPDAGRWSIGEHISHLALTNDEYLDTLEAALEEAREKGHLGPPPYDSSFIGSRFVRSLEPPVNRRFKTFKRLIPPAENETPIADRLAAFERGMDRYAALLESNADIDFGRARMRSPFLWFLRLTLAEGAETVLAHNRRHLWLVDEVVRSPGFPAAGHA
jgi:hypothetical protein